MESRSATCVFRVGIPADSRQYKTEWRACSKLFDTGSMSSHPHRKDAMILDMRWIYKELRIDRKFELLTMQGRDMLSVHPGMQRIRQESRVTNSKPVP